MFLAPTLAYDIGKKGLHIKITIDEIDSEGYYTGKVETNTFVFSEFTIEPTSQKRMKRKNRIVLMTIETRVDDVEDIHTGFNEFY